MPLKTKRMYGDVFYIRCDDGSDDVYICGLAKNIIEKVLIPGYINGHKVREIEEGAFLWSVFSEAIIEDGVESIKPRAFAFNNKLREITIPPSVKEIDNSAFVKRNENLTILCAANSYAEKWGKSHGIKTKIIKSKLTDFIEQNS